MNVYVSCEKRSRMKVSRWNGAVNLFVVRMDYFQELCAFVVVLKLLYEEYGVQQ